MAMSCAFEHVVWLGASVATPSPWRLLLERRYIRLEPVKAGFPDGALRGEPVLGPLHGAWDQAACADAAMLLRLDEATGFGRLPVGGLDGGPNAGYVGGLIEATIALRATEAIAAS
jgi:hypothetical protein